MPKIQVLDQHTIDKIAAGEVVERPASIVKELVENAIDAQASAITVEIKEGGISFIRITDNGCGIEQEQVATAFLPHATSKIRQVEDLMNVSSLGFRGEALASIAAVSQVELITKTSMEISGTRYVIEGGIEKSMEEIGAPDGTTFLVRNLFYNTPVRRKFLKTPATEAGYIGEIMNRMALSHPEVAFKLIVNNQTKLHTTGNSNLKEVIYHIYGRDISSNLIEVKEKTDFFFMEGYIGKPVISRGNRNYENYFINGRYVKCNLMNKGIEEGFRPFSMHNKYPFTVLHFSIPGDHLDVNVHPTKMELRFQHQEEVYQNLHDVIQRVIKNSELIGNISLETKRETKKFVSSRRTGEKTPEPFEKKRLEEIRTRKRLEELQEFVRKSSPYEKKYLTPSEESSFVKEESVPIEQAETTSEKLQQIKQTETTSEKLRPIEQTETTSEKLQQIEQEETTDHKIQAEQKEAISLQKKTGQLEVKDFYFSGSEMEKANLEDQEFPGTQKKLLDGTSFHCHRIIGQLFHTYWLVEMEEKLYIIDQHAAHEKVLYEKIMHSIKQREHTSQMVFPPILLSLSIQEEEILEKYKDYFEKLGFVIEHFGGKEYALTSVPGNLFQLDEKNLFLEILDRLSQLRSSETPEMILEKVASISCKAAVKGNAKLSNKELEHLIEQLLELENPYHCPHGRPTIISMTKYELEKKFKRVL